MNIFSNKIIIGLILCLLLLPVYSQELNNNKIKSWRKHSNNYFMTLLEFNYSLTPDQCPGIKLLSVSKSLDVNNLFLFGLTAVDYSYKTQSSNHNIAIADIIINSQIFGYSYGESTWKIDYALTDYLYMNISALNFSFDNNIKYSPKIKFGNNLKFFSMIGQGTFGVDTNYTIELNQAGINNSVNQYFELGLFYRFPEIHALD